MTGSILQYLPPRFRDEQNPTARAFDTPARTPLINQGGRPVGPQRLSGRELRNIVQGLPPLVEVREVNRYADCVVQPFSLVAAGIAGALQLLVKNERDRFFLSFRNQVASTGNLLIGLGVAPDVNTAAFSVPIGGTLVLDIVVPQNDIWVGTDTATTLGVLAYALSDVPHY